MYLRNPFLPMESVAFPIGGGTFSSDPLLSPLHKAVISGDDKMAKQYLKVFGSNIRDSEGTLSNNINSLIFLN